MDWEKYAKQQQMYVVDFCGGFTLIRASSRLKIHKLTSYLLGELGCLSSFVLCSSRSIRNIPPLSVYVYVWERCRPKSKSEQCAWPEGQPGTAWDREVDQKLSRNGPDLFEVSQNEAQAWHHCESGWDALNCWNRSPPLCVSNSSCDLYFYVNTVNTCQYCTCLIMCIYIYTYIYINK